MADLYLTEDRATADEATAIDEALAAIGAERAELTLGERLIRGGTSRKNEGRHYLLPALHALQTHSGWISPGGLNHIADFLQVPPAEAYGVASFYEMFNVDAAPGHEEDVVHVCVDAACQIAASDDLIVKLEAEGKHVHRSPCLGQCERAPAVFIQGRQKANTVPSDWADDGQPAAFTLAQAHDPELKLLQRVGRIDPTSLEQYIGAGGFKALAEAFRKGADGVLEDVSASGLMGRGGAAFPTGIKWKAVAAESGDKFIVVNADESEPGTFKDRIIMEHDPFSLVEAATIAGFATGAEKGYVYIRGEYPLATARLQNAIDQSLKAGFLGDGIARSSIKFDLEIRRGAGAYICGEETALFNSLEGFRGEPRQKPPFPTTNGLFDKPTAINNPETLINVLPIVLGGGEAYAGIGTERSSGPKLFCLSGHIGSPGVYEVPFGVTLGEMIEIAGGVTGNLQAILLGGAAGTFVGPDHLDMPLTFEGSRERGASLGSGVIMPMNDTTNFDSVVTRIAEFFRNESCGQCVPCRVGVVRQHEILVKNSGRSLNGSVKLIEEMDLAMKDASICGLGHTAATAVLSAIAMGLIGAS